MNISLYVENCGNIVFAFAHTGEHEVVGTARLCYERKLQIDAGGEFVGVIDQVYVDPKYRLLTCDGDKTLDNLMVLKLIEVNNHRRKPDGNALVGLLDLTAYQEVRREYEALREKSAAVSA